MTRCDVKERSSNTLDPMMGVFERHIPHYGLLIHQAAFTRDVLDQDYPGTGTGDDPYLISWIENDSRNPVVFSQARKIGITIVLALSTMIATATSSIYTGSLNQIKESFQVSTPVATLGLSTFVLGFGLGPLLWAPISEMYGRQIPFFCSLFAMAAFSAGCAGAPNMWSLCILRFFAGAFGSSPVSNAGGVISDIYCARERGLAMSFYGAAPLLGPCVGPIIGGFLSLSTGWRYTQGIVACMNGLAWIMMALVVPETYAPVLLRRRAERLSCLTGLLYRNQMDGCRNGVSLFDSVRDSLSRPLLLLSRELIVLLFALYIALIYGTLYMFFTAFPIVFEGSRGWKQGTSALPFLGIMVGMLTGGIANIVTNRRYMKSKPPHDDLTPERRLVLCMPAAIAIPISQFWFAWGNDPFTHWIICTLATIPFGFGVLVIWLGVMNYLVDAYHQHAASALAANSVLRSLFGAVLPILAPILYGRVGIHWGASVPGFLSLLFLPAPFLLSRYGSSIRVRSRYAA